MTHNPYAKVRGRVIAARERERAAENTAARLLNLALVRHAVQFGFSPALIRAQRARALETAREQTRAANRLWARAIVSLLHWFAE